MSKLEVELSLRKSSGMGTALRKARQRSGTPHLYAKGAEQAYVTAYIAGPIALDGRIEVGSANVIRYSVSDLKSRVESSEKGVLVEAVIAKEKPWPTTLTLTYRSDKNISSVVVSRWVAEDGSAAFYTGTAGVITLNAVTVKPSLVVTAVRKAGKNLVPPKSTLFAVETSRSSTERIFYYRTNHP